MLRTYSTCCHPGWQDGTNYATLILLSHISPLVHLITSAPLSAPSAASASSAPSAVYSAALPPSLKQLLRCNALREKMIGIILDLGSGFTLSLFSKHWFYWFYWFPFVKNCQQCHKVIPFYCSPHNLNIRGSNVTFLHQRRSVGVWFQVGFLGFSWFQVGFSWFFMVPGWFFMVFHGFHSSGLVCHGFSPKCTRPNCILAQRSILGPPPGGRHRT